MYLLLPVLLAIELSLRYQMCDLCSIFEEDRTKTAVVVMVAHIDRRTAMHDIEQSIK